VEPAWGKLVVPLERIVDRLDVVWNVVDHLKAVKDSADLRAAVEDVQVPNHSSPLLHRITIRPPAVADLPASHPVVPPSLACLNLRLRSYVCISCLANPPACI
jgi:hypothetical protein